MKMGVGLPAERRAAVLHSEETSRADDTTHHQANLVTRSSTAGTDSTECATGAQAERAVQSERSSHRSATHDRATEAFPVVKQSPLLRASRGSRTRNHGSDSAAFTVWLGMVVNEGVEPSPRVLIFSIRRARYLCAKSRCIHSTPCRGMRASDVRDGCAHQAALTRLAR